jgi:hypothetical protein
MLLGLLIHWNVTGRPHYPSMDPTQSIAYISDVGAQSLKPLFIAGSCVTTIFLDASFLSERWLRHRGRLARNTSLMEKVLSGLSLGFAIIGTAGLILLTIFDTLRHPTLHDIFLLLFIAGYVVSAIFICWEYQRLGIRECPKSTSNIVPQLESSKPQSSKPPNKIKTNTLTLRFPRTPHPPHLLLDKTLLHPPRDRPRNRLRRLQFPEQV